MSKQPCVKCGHPVGSHGRSGCYMSTSGKPTEFCSCELTHDRVLLEQALATLSRARALLDNFAQCAPVSLDEVVAVLAESGELLTEEL